MKFRRYIVAALLIAMMVPTGALLLPRHAEAQAGGLISCAAMFGLGGASAALGGVAGILGGSVPVFDAGVNTNTGAVVQKECGLDAIAFALAKIAIQALTTSILNWINSGFEGSPAFVTDLEQFLYDIDVEVFENFLGSDAIAFLCTPWQFDIQLALELQFSRTTNVPECSLGDVVGDIDQFLAGDFSQGGWQGWTELTVRNNPYQDFFIAQAELDAEIAAARFREVTLLDFGRGFLSFEQCTSRPANPTDPNALPGDIIEDCAITTPGAVIESQLENVLGSGVRQLELADEINEVITAFLSQLVNQVITTGLSNL